MKRYLFVLIVFLAAGVSGCREATPLPLTATLAPTSTPAPTATPTTMPTPTQASTGMERFQVLLAYMSSEWADNHPYEALPPGILLFDVARMHTDLGLPPMTGADDRKVKLGLISGMNTQGFGLAYLDLTNASAFDKWGWDIADVDQLLNDLSGGITILLGDFERPEIEERLLSKGYQARRVGEFIVYTEGTEQVEFAIKSDTLIISQDESEIERLLQHKPSTGRGLNRHPSVVALLDHLGDDAWGIWITPHGDADAFSAYAQNALDVISKIEKKEIANRFAEFYKPGQGVEFEWDMMALGWREQNDLTALTFLYHYPSEEEAQKDVPLLRKILTEMPNLTHRGRRLWGDIISLQSVEARDTVVKAVATTNNKTLIGPSYPNRDFGFLPFRAVPLKPFPDWQEISSPEGIFSILMPGVPNTRTQMLNTPMGDIDAHWVVFTWQDSVYAVIYVDYPESFVQQIGSDGIFDNMRDGFKSQFALLDELVISLDKYTGRELRVKSIDEANSMRLRLFLIENRLYQVTIASPGEEAFSKDMDQFFDSFKLLNK